jgi:PRTRC genetic system ThiF family protein|tara:strand:- start:5546 stop:6367 length:822 start_codon:yes stop_codon:yes gene_type:complete
MTQLTLSAPLHLQTHAIKVLVLGCGGNGSSFIQSSLYRLHVALKGLGHPYGIIAYLADGADVSETNVLRSAFYPQDVGFNKALLLASRMNMSGLDTDFHAIPRNLTTDDVRAFVTKNDIDFVVGAVDDAKFRADLVNTFKQSTSYYRKDCMYLDMGNASSSGQVVLGHLIKKESHHSHYIPNVYDLFPEIEHVISDKTRSCSARESFDQQGVLVNQQCALLAGRLLNDYLTKNNLQHHGFLFDFDKGVMSPIKANTNNWLIYGYVAPEEQKIT